MNKPARRQQADLTHTRAEALNTPGPAPLPKEKRVQIKLSRYALFSAIALGIFASTSFLSWQRAALLVLGTVLARRWLHLGLRRLAILYRTANGVHADPLVSTPHASEDLDPPWIHPVKAVLILGLMFTFFPHLGLPYPAITILGRTFVMLEALERTLTNPVRRIDTQLSFWITVAIYLAPVALGRFYR